MTNKQELSKICLEERERLLQKYLGNLSKESATSLEQIRNLMAQMEDEYKLFLTNLWEQIKETNDNRTLDNILDKRMNRTMLAKAYSLPIETALKSAKEITLWEQITNSNYRDIEHLNALVGAYARDLLAHITLDFMEDVQTVK